MTINFSAVDPFRSLQLSNPTTKRTQTPVCTLGQYEQFKKEFVFDKLRGSTFGQSFCEKFGITDNMLSIVTSETEADYLVRALGYVK
jgi:hypothetical protein